MKTLKTNPGYLLVISLFIFLTAPALFTEGMVMDGVLYASISRNMAEGLGSFWKPYLSEGLFPVFYEHPPLALGMQSLGFRIFGDSIFVERFYSLLTYFLLGGIMVALWVQFTQQRKTGWIPLLFFVSMFKIPWACANNMLENTMSVFIGLSVLFYLWGFNRRKYFLVIVSGVFLFLATLTKGLVGLYVWGFPFLIWLFNRKYSFQKIVLHTATLVFFTGLPILLLIVFWPDAANFFTHYFEGQVMGSLKNSVTVEHRYFIIQAVVYHTLPIVFIVFVLFLVSWFLKIKIRVSHNHVNSAFSLFLLALCGILPITLSMKQSGHYAITVYPYIAIAVGLIIHVLWDELIVKYKFLTHKSVTFLAYILFALSIVFSVNQVGKPGYQNKIVTDCKEIVAKIGPRQTIGICPQMYGDWFLHGYFARYGNISLDARTAKQHEYVLMDSKCSNTFLNSNYQEVELNSDEYQLFQKREDSPHLIK